MARMAWSSRAGQGGELTFHLGPEPRARRRQIAAERGALDHQRRDRDRRGRHRAAERDAHRRARHKGWKGHPHRHCRM